MTDKEIAKYLGVTRMTVYNWKAGVHPVPKMAKEAMKNVPNAPEYLR